MLSESNVGVGKPINWGESFCERKLNFLNPSANLIGVIKRIAIVMLFYMAKIGGYMYILILKIAVVLLFGFIGGKIASKLKLPEVSGYLIFGILLGPSLGLIVPDFGGIVTTTDQESLKFIGDIALSFIAFSIGSEFNIKSLKKTGKAVNIIALLEVVFAVAFVFIALLFVPKPSEITSGYAPFSKENIAFVLILASMSAATAPAATLMVIRQYRAHGPLTKTILPVTALDDIYGIVIFGLFISIAQILTSSTGDMPLWLMITKPLIEVFGSIIIGVIIGVVLSFVNGKFAKNRDNKQVLSVMAIMLSIGIIWLLNNSLDSVSISFSPLLVNIMVGTMIANLVKKPSETFSSVNDLSTPVYILFFTLAGASLDLNILKTSGIVILLSVVYIFARGLGKYTGATVGARIAQSPPMVKKYLGFGLLPQGGVSLGLLVVVSSKMPSFYQWMATIIMLSIMVYETSGPIFAKFAISKAGEINGLDKLQELSNLEVVENKQAEENMSTAEGV